VMVGGGGFLTPAPIADFGKVVAMRDDVALVFEEAIAHGLLDVGGFGAERGKAVRRIADEMVDRPGFGWREMVELLEARPDLAALNGAVRQKPALS